MNRRSLGSAIVAAICAVFVVNAGAKAQDPANSGPPKEGAPPVIGGNLPITIAEVSERPGIGAGIMFNGGLLAAAMVGFTYNGNGLPSNDPSAPPSDDKFGINVGLHLEYMIVNEKPFGTGPEITYLTSLAPNDPFSVNILEPGWAFWYTPFQAPIALGIAWNVRVTLVKDLDPIVDFVTPGIRFGALLSRPPKR